MNLYVTFDEFVNKLYDIGWLSIKALDILIYKNYRKNFVILNWRKMNNKNLIDN